MANLQFPIADELVKQGEIIGGSKVDIAHPDIDMGVRAGARETDISSSGDWWVVEP